MREFITFVRGCMSNGPRRLRDWRNACARQLKSSEDPNESGAALVEFTIIMPLFFLIFFGIIEWGLIFFYQNTMQSAAEMAARAVAVNNWTTSNLNLIKPYVCPSLVSGSLTFTVTTVDQSPTCAVQATITTTAASVSIINYLSMIGGNLTAKASMPKEPVASCTGNLGTIQFSCP